MMKKQSNELAAVAPSDAANSAIPKARITPLASTVGPDPNAQPDIGVILHSVRRQWLKAAVLGLILAVPLAVGVWMVQPVKYTSEAFLRLSANQVPLVFETADTARRVDFKTFKNTQKQILLTPFVLNNALSREEVASLPVVKEQPAAIDWLRESLTIDFPSDSEIMRISLTCGDAVAAQRIVNAVVNAYLEEVVLNDQKERTSRLENLEVVAAEAESKARGKRADLRRLADTLGTSDTGSLSLAQQGAVSQFGLLRGELTKVQFELMRAEGELKLLESKHEGEKAAAAANPTQQAAVEEPVVQTPQAELPAYSELELQELFAKDSIIQKASEEIAAINFRISEVQSRLTPEAAERYLVKYQPQLKEAEDRLAARQDQVRNLLIERTAVARASEVAKAASAAGGTIVGGELVTDPRVAVQNKVDVLKLQEQQLAAEVAKLEDEVKKYGRSSIDAEMLRSEIAGLDAVVGQVRGEIERTKIELKSSSRFEILSEALPAVASDKKRAYAMTGMAGLAGLFLPMGLLVWRDASRKHINGLVTITQGLGLNVLGSVPTARSRDLNALRLPTKGTSTRGEALQDCFGSIAAMIMHNGSVRGQRVILVSSATAGEGKSTLAAHLAKSLADAGNRTLLVDFDLRRPSLHRNLGLQAAPGVGDVLEQTISVKEALQTPNFGGLHVLTAGNRNFDLIRHASQGTLVNLFNEIRSDFDYVIVDSSPILPCPDSRVLAQHADGVVLSVLKDVSQVPKVMAARDILADYGVSVIGTVAAGCAVDSYYYNVRQPNITVSN